MGSRPKSFFLLRQINYRKIQAATHCITNYESVKVGPDPGRVKINSYISCLLFIPVDEK